MERVLIKGISIDFQKAMSLVEVGGVVLLNCSGNWTDCQFKTVDKKTSVIEKSEIKVLKSILHDLSALIEVSGNAESIQKELSVLHSARRSYNEAVRQEKLKMRQELSQIDRDISQLERNKNQRESKVKLEVGQYNRDLDAQGREVQAVIRAIHLEIGACDREIQAVDRKLNQAVRSVERSMRKVSGAELSELEGEIQQLQTEASQEKARIMATKEELESRRLDEQRKLMQLPLGKKTSEQALAQDSQLAEISEQIEQTQSDLLRKKARESLKRYPPFEKEDEIVQLEKHLVNLGTEVHDHSERIFEMLKSIDAFANLQSCSLNVSAGLKSQGRVAIKDNLINALAPVSVDGRQYTLIVDTEISFSGGTIETDNLSIGSFNNSSISIY